MGWPDGSYPVARGRPQPAASVLRILNALTDWRSFSFIRSREVNVRPKEVRARAGLSLIEAAVLAGKAEGTVRVYEADPGGGY